MATTYYKSTTPGNWNAAASWDLHSGHAGGDGIPVAGDTVYFDASSTACTITATAACLTLDQTGYAATLTLNSGISLTVTGDVKFVTGGFVAAADTSILQIQNSITLTTGGCLLGNLIFYKVGGTLTLGDALAFRAGKTCILSLNSTGVLDLNGYSVSGNSATNRLLILSNVLGAARTITDSTGAMTTADFANCDFQDIQFVQTTAGDLDFQTDGVLAGNCGGNTQTGGGTLTLTTPTTQTFAWAGGGDGLWHTAANWTSRVPLPQDTVVMGNLGANGRTIVVNMPRYGGDVSFAAATSDGSTPVTSLTVTENTAGLTYTNYGDLDLTKVTTFLHNKAIAFQARTNATLTSAGNSFGVAVTVALAGGAGNNTLTLADAFSNVAASVCQLTQGVLAATASVATSGWLIAGGTLCYLGPVTWSISGTVAPWNVANNTIVAEDSTIALTGTAGTASTFGGGANTYNNITVTPSATNVLTFSGAFTVANLTMDGTVGAKTVKFTKATTYHVTGTSFLEGTSGAPITIQSTVDDPTVAGDMYTLHFAGTGYVSTDWLVVKGCVTDLATNWYAGANTTHDHNGDDLTPPQPTWTWGTPSGVTVYPTWLWTKPKRYGIQGVR